MPESSRVELAADFHLYHCWIPTGIILTDAPQGGRLPVSMRSNRNGSVPVPTRHGASEKWAGTVKTDTRRKYRKVVESFNHFLSEIVTIGDICDNYADVLCSNFTALRRSGSGWQEGNLASAGLKNFLPGSRLPKDAKFLKAWAARAPPKPWPCIPEAAVILLISASLRRGWIHVAGGI